MAANAAGLGWPRPRLWTRKGSGCMAELPQTSAVEAQPAGELPGGNGRTAELPQAQAVQGLRRGRAVQVRPLPGLRLIQVRGRSLPKDALAAIGPDPAPLTWQGPLVWTGPNERLIVAPGDWDARALEQLPPGCHALDLSQGLAAFELSGPGAEALVRGETAAVRFEPGFAARLRFADLAVVILVLDARRIRLLAERSVAAWLFDWLGDRIQAQDL